MQAEHRADPKKDQKTDLLSWQTSIYVIWDSLADPTWAEQGSKLATEYEAGVTGLDFCEVLVHNHGENENKKNLGIFTATRWEKTHRKRKLYMHCKVGSKSRGLHFNVSYGVTGIVRNQFLLKAQDGGKCPTPPTAFPVWTSAAGQALPYCSQQ